MNVAGSVALVVAADSVLGAAIARGLLARGAVKVYRVLKDGASEHVQPGVLPLFVDPARRAGARKLARELDDVTLLVNCLVAVQQSDSALSGVDIQPLGWRSSAAGRTLNLIDAFAPLFAARGGGVVVNVLSVLCADPPLDDATPRISRRRVERALGDGLQERLASQRTQLLNFEAQLAVGRGVELLEDQRALAGYVATRVLDRLESMVAQPATSRGATRP